MKPPMIPTTINGSWELLLPQHRAERPEWQTGWERERLASMHANLRPGDVVVDVGTEEGDISALLAQWVREACCLRCGHKDTTTDWAGECRSCTGQVTFGGGVILMEPNPKVWPNVQAIFDANQLPPPVGWWVGFAGHETELGTGPDHQNWNGHDDPWPSCTRGPIIGNHGFCNLWERPDMDKIRLDDLCYALGRIPDAITMDTEGSELRVIQGAERILTENHPLVWISIHPTFSVDMYGLTREDLLRMMQSFGYRAEWLATDHEEHWAFWHPEGRRLEDFR